jgi:hypothetical protein
MLDKIVSIVSKALLYAGVVAAAAYVVVFVVMAVIRLSYPFELEWMEGATVDHVARVLSGQPLYCEPSLDFTPFRYTPLYYYVSAVVACVTGIGFLPLRLVSLVATLGCLAVLVLFVKKETGSFLAASISAGFFAATYPAGGTWFDAARVDMLFVFFLLAALYVIRFHFTFRGAVLAGVLVFLSFFAKQVGLLAAAPLFIYCLVVNRRLGVVFICTVVLLVVGSTLLLEKVSGGWYYFYAFEMGKHIAYKGSLLGRLWSFLKALVFVPFPVVTVLATLFLFRSLWRGAGLAARFFHLSVVVGLTGAALLLWINAGSYNNNLIPAHALLALMVGPGLHAVVQYLQRGKIWLKAAVPLVAMALIWQFAGLRYEPSKYLPTEADRRAGEQFLSKLASYDGEVMVAFHGFIPTLAGKQVHANRMALTDVLTRSTGRVRDKLLGQVQTAIKEQRFAAVVLDHRWFLDEMKASYQVSGPVFDDTTVFWPVTGWRIRPQEIWVPRKE